jgi:hypothetical protein
VAEGAVVQLDANLVLALVAAFIILAIFAGLP